jgi:hypothetical protein
MIKKFLKNRKSALPGALKIFVLALSLLTTVQVMAKDTTIVSGHVLADGEILYKGWTKLEKCDSVEVVFILSADKASIKICSIDLYGIYFSYSNETAVQKMESKTSYPSLEKKVVDGAVDYKHFWQSPNVWRLIVKDLGSNNVTGKLSYTYAFNTQAVDLGTGSIIFKEVK